MVLGGVETIKSSTGHQLSTILLARVWYDPPPPMAHPPEAACACAQAADSHISGRQIVASNHRKQVHRLRPADRAIQQRDAPVEGTGGSALSRVQERIRRSDVGGQGRARARVHGARGRDTTSEGNERPLTRLQPFEESSNSSSSCPRRLLKGARGRTLTPAQRERDGRTSHRTRFSLCDRDGW